MIGKRVSIHYIENSASVDTDGVIMDKVRNSVVLDGILHVYDNYLVKKDDGSCKLFHPSLVIKIHD